MKGQNAGLKIKSDGDRKISEKLNKKQGYNQGFIAIKLYSFIVPRRIVCPNGKSQIPLR